MKKMLAPWWAAVLFALVWQLPFAAPAAAQPQECMVGQELGPGDSCTIPGGPGRTYTIEVRDDGQACITGPEVPANFCQDTVFNEPLLRGFEASRIEGTSRWRIDAMPGIPAPALPLAALAALALLLWRAGARRLRRLT